MVLRHMLLCGGLGGVAPHMGCKERGGGGTALLLLGYATVYAGGGYHTSTSMESTNTMYHIKEHLITHRDAVHINP